MFDRILVPTDGSDVASRAGYVAVNVALQFDSDLSVVCISAPGENTPEDCSSAVGDVERVASDAGLDSMVDVVDAEESVHRGILEFATDVEADLVVMGTHGRTGVGRVLLGSVAEKILQESEIPVMTVHDETNTAFEVERILVPTDGSVAAESAAELAVEFAKSADASLHAIHVTEPELGGPDETAKAAIEHVREIANQADLERVEATIRNGRPHQEIAGYATEAGIDCIVMGSHGRSGLRRYVLGSVTERMVRFSPVPVISVTPPQ